MYLEYALIFATFLLSLTPACLIAHWFIKPRKTAITVSILLYLVIFFGFTWQQQGNLEYTMMFFLYILMVLPIIVAVLIIAIIWSMVIRRVIQPLKKRAFSLGPVIAAITLVTIVMLTTVFYLLQYQSYHESQRVQKDLEKLPVCGPDIHNSCRAGSVN